MKPPGSLGSYFLTAPVNALRGAVVTQRNRRAAARLDALDEAVESLTAMVEFQLSGD